MAFNAFESIATSFSDNRKKLEQSGLSTPSAPPAPPPAPTPTPVTEVRPPMAAPVQPVPAVAQPATLPEGVVAGLAHLQQRGLRHGVDTTTSGPHAGQDIVTYLEDMNEAFDLMDAQKGGFFKQLGRMVGEAGDATSRFFGWDDGILSEDFLAQEKAWTSSIGQAAAEKVEEDAVLRKGLEGAQFVNDVGAGTLALQTAPIMDQVARFPDIMMAQDEADIMEALGRSTQYSEFLDNLDENQRIARENDIGLLEALKFESLRKAYQETEFHPLVRLGYDVAGDVTNLAAVTGAPLIGKSFLGGGKSANKLALESMLKAADDRALEAGFKAARNQRSITGGLQVDELLQQGQFSPEGRSLYDQINHELDSPNTPFIDGAAPEAGVQAPTALRSNRHFGDSVIPSFADIRRAIDKVSPIGVADASSSQYDEALEKAQDDLAALIDRNVKAENSRDPKIRDTAFGGPEARMQAELEASDLINKIANGEVTPESILDEPIEFVGTPRAEAELTDLILKKEEQIRLGTPTPEQKAFLEGQRDDLVAELKYSRENPEKVAPIVDKSTVEGLQQIIGQITDELQTPTLAQNHRDALETNRMQYQRLLDEKMPDPGSTDAYKARPDAPALQEGVVGYSDNDVELKGGFNESVQEAIADLPDGEEVIINGERYVKEGTDQPQLIKRSLEDIDADLATADNKLLGQQLTDTEIRETKEQITALEAERRAWTPPPGEPPPPISAQDQSIIDRLDDEGFREPGEDFLALDSIEKQRGQQQFNPDYQTDEMVEKLRNLGFIDKRQKFPRVTNRGRRQLREWREQEEVYNNKFNTYRDQLPTEPVAPAAGYEKQHGFTDTGELTTYESQATEGVEQFDDKLAQSEMNIPKTDDEFNATDELYEFGEGELVDNQPTYPLTYQETPLSQAQKDIDVLEQEIEDLVNPAADDAAREASEREVLHEIELEQRANSEIAGWADVLLAPGKHTFPVNDMGTEGLTPKQAWKIMGLSEEGLPLTGKSRISGKGKNKKVGKPVRKVEDYYDAAEKKWGESSTTGNTGRVWYGPDPAVHKMFPSPLRTKLMRRKNWLVNLEAIDEINADIAAISPSYDPNVVGSDTALANIMRDVQDGKAAKIEWKELQARRAGDEADNASNIAQAREELAELRRKQLLEANDKIIDVEGNQIDTTTGEILEDSQPHKKTPVTEGETIYVDAQGNEVSYEDALASDVLDIGAVGANDLNIQNPAAFSDPVVREQAERYIRDLRGPYSPEEVAELEHNELANLVAQNISRQNPRRGTMSTGGQGARPNAVDPVQGTGDPVELGPPRYDGQQTQGGIRPDLPMRSNATAESLAEEARQAAIKKQRLAAAQKTVTPPTGSVDEVEQGLEYPVPGTSRATQSSQAEAERASRIKPSQLLPAGVVNETEARAAYNGQMFMPNTEIKSQVAAAAMREAVESGVPIQEVEQIFVDLMPPEKITPTKEMLRAVSDRLLRDIGERTAQRLDPGRIANTVDGGQSVGAATNSIIETTQRLDDTGRIWLDGRIRSWERLKDTYRMKNKSDLKRLTEVIEHLSGENDLNAMPRDLIRTKPSLADSVSGLSIQAQDRFVRAAQDARILLDNIHGFQNAVRAKRGQRLIPYKPDYMPHIREQGFWGKLGGLYERSDIAARDIPDFVPPEKMFNPRELARKWGMSVNNREMNADTLIRSYMVTAQKDVFHTEIVRNIKANTKLWREASTDRYSLINAADAFDNYGAEVYLGVPTAWSKAIRSLVGVNTRVPVNTSMAQRFTSKTLNIAKFNGNIPIPGTDDKVLPSVIDASILLRQGLTRSVFPLNWTWNAFIQTSSGLLTPVRYGARNSLRAMNVIWDDALKEQIDTHSYVARTKGRRGNSVVLQNTADDVYAFDSAPSWYERVTDWANFISNTIERNLTRHAIQTAKLRGEQLGYTGAELWQYASQGGARTQSMYNKADTVGVLRSREISAMLPFQTFAFEMLNTLAETNIPGLRKVTGNLGAYNTFSAAEKGGAATTYRRIKNLGIWIAGAVTINAISDRVSNRQPWNVTSFIPAWSFLMGGTNGLGPGSAVLPAKFLYDVTKAFNAAVKHGETRDLASVGLRYFGIPGGTQLDKTWAGATAVDEGVVRNRDRTTKFEVDPPKMTGVKVTLPIVGELTLTDSEINPEEYIKTYGQGIWSTNGGQQYLDKQLGRNELGRSYLKRFMDAAQFSAGIEGVNLGGGGKIGSLERNWKDTWDEYYIIPSDNDLARRKGLPTRALLRENNPWIDARLFVVGKVSSLRTEEAKQIARELIVEHDLLNLGGGLVTSRAVPWKTEKVYRKVLGDAFVDQTRGGSTNTGAGNLLDQGGGIAPIDFGSTPETQSSAPQTATEQWRLVSAYLTRENLVALQKIWEGEAISRPESSSLKAVFEKAPLGQTNFRKWSRQTLRQVHENAAVQSSREAVTV